MSIIDIGEGVFEVVATAGNNRLGGDDFDNKIVDFLADSFKQTEGVDLRGDRMAMQRLREAARKPRLSCQALLHPTSICLISRQMQQVLSIWMSLTRAKFDELTSDLVQKTIDPVKRAMSDAGISASDIDKVILVGGSTRIPAVQGCS